MTNTPFSNYHATGKKKFTLSSDANSAEDLINFADSIHPGGLDSMDLGDAFGAFCEYLENADRELIISGEFPTGNQMLVGPGFTVTISSEWELFDWKDSLNSDTDFHF